ncbi:MAG: fasciclin domain-containing protein [Pseudomonadota bacterium]
MNRWFKVLAALGLVASLAACGGSDDDPPGNIVQVAQANKLTALEAAVTKAGLATALTDPTASLTVFAPTDAAFAALATQLGFPSAGALVEALPANTLASILTYHVLPTRKSAADLVAGGATQPTLYAFEGTSTRLTLSTTAGVKITDAALTTANVVTADVPASNGIVHVIDKVLVPPGVLNIVQMAQVNPVFSTLVGAVVTANLQGTLSGAGPFTVFAPTNDAFAAIQTTVAGLSTAQLTQVLTYHVLPAQVLAAAIPFGTPVATVEGQTITINPGTPPTISDKTATPAPIVATDVRASNGVIHVIGKVLIPTL